jgi:hypothetical protein
MPASMPIKVEITKLTGKAYAGADTGGSLGASANAPISVTPAGVNPHIGGAAKRRHLRLIRD